MLHEIHNGILSVAAETAGAQLMSIRTADGAELLWQGDPAYWSDRALNLFPYVARLWQGTYTLDGQTYSLPIHGFAPYSEFAPAEKTDTRMVFELRESEATLGQYPRKFIFRIAYELIGAQLATTFEVANCDEKPMFFGLGGHPGFNVPLEAGRAFSDYRLRFSEPCAPVRVGFSDDCFVNGEDQAFPLENGTDLPLRHDLFDEDAIVLKNMACNVTLEAPGGAKDVTVTFPDMPYLGIWHWPKTDAPYVCIEPWVSLPAKRGEVTALEEQADLIRLAPGKTYRNTWTIEVHE